MSDLVPAGSDPYSAYAAKVVQQEGTFLTFKNGEFLHGKEGESLKLGTRLIANVAEIRVGWRRWFAAKVTDDQMVPLSTQTPIARRDHLGDLDESLWELDDRGKPRDPWIFTNTLELATDDGEIYIYSTGSKGGLNAVGKLCKAFGLEYRQRPGMVPIVELGNDFYMHATYGKTYFPVFTLVGWTNAEDPSTAPQAAIPAPNSKAKAKRDLDDEIPF